MKVLLCTESWFILFQQEGWWTQISLDFLGGRDMNNLEKIVGGGIFQKITRNPYVMHCAYPVVFAV